MSKARFNTWVVMPANDRSLDDRRRYVRWPARACGTEEYATEEQAIRAARLANAAEGLLRAAKAMLADIDAHGISWPNSHDNQLRAACARASGEDEYDNYSNQTAERQP